MRVGHLWFAVRALAQHTSKQDTELHSRQIKKAPKAGRSVRRRRALIIMTEMSRDDDDGSVVNWPRQLAFIDSRWQQFRRSLLELLRQ